MKTFVGKILWLTGVWQAVTTASAQNYALDSISFNSGGGTGSGGTFAVSSTIGRAAPQPMNGAGFSLTGDFSGVVRAVSAQTGPTTLFDNAEGSENGGIGATDTKWLGARFLMGSRSYQFSSISLLLTNGRFDGQPSGSSKVRLQLYDADPMTGKPSVSTGLVMTPNVTNPFPVAYHQWVEWTSDTPFVLAANTAYFAVFSVESGPTVGLFASFTRPSGEAGAFGTTVTNNAGTIWGAPDDSVNYKMLVKGTSPATVPSPAPELAADTQTAIPGGTGNFTGFLTGPSLSGNNLAFYGTGGGGQQGLYLTTLGSMQVPAVIANLNTPIPEGFGSFLSFGTEAGIIIVSGNTAVFTGGGSGGQQGLYATAMSPPFAGTPLRIADLTTPIPGGTGNFTEFPRTADLSGNNVVFTARGTGAQEGIYAATLLPPTVSAPVRIADTATAIPEGSGSFTEFPHGPAISGNNTVFAGNGADGQRGVYGTVLAPAQLGSPFRIADTSTAIPNGTGNFTDFGSEAGIIIVSGNTAVFDGTGAGGQRGIYASLLAPPFAGVPSRIADTTTAIPGGTGNFTAFGTASVSATDIAFLGMGAGGQTGIYDLTAGQLLKVVSVGEAINGRMITGLKFSRGGLFEDPIAFQATFEDGSQGVYRIPVRPPVFEFRVTGLEQDGSDLRLSYTSLAGITYAIQSSDDLSLGPWGTVPGTTIFGTGGVVEQILPGVLTGSRQFYRVLQQP